MKKILLLLFAVGLPSGASAQLDVPGLALDHPELSDLQVGVSYGSSGSPYGHLGAPASVRGVKPAGTGTVVGHLKAGQVPKTSYLLFPALPTSPYGGNTAKEYYLPTLMPPFAAGAVGQLPSTGSGPFVQAILYEPDQVKRTGRPAARSKLLLKQKSYLAFRLGQFTSGGVPNPISGAVVVPSCKATAVLRRDAADLDGDNTQATMKVACGGSSTQAQRIKDALEVVFGKPAKGFKLEVAFDSELPPAAPTQMVDVPGLALDHPALADLNFGAYYSYFGGPAKVQGAKNGLATSSVVGNLKAGQMPKVSYFLYPGFPSPSGGTTVKAYYVPTLAPPFAAGVVGHITSTGGGAHGPFVQAILYEPDRVKRRGRWWAKSGLSLVQKSYVAFRLGVGRFTAYGGQPSVISGGLVVPECKASARLRADANQFNGANGRTKMRVSCSGKSSEAERVRDALRTVFGKSRSGFKLDASFYY